MHTRFRTDLHALKGSTFIYAWWFFLGSPIVPDKTFWSIFQVYFVLNALINIQFTKKEFADK